MVGVMVGKNKDAFMGRMKGCVSSSYGRVKEQYRSVFLDMAEEEFDIYAQQLADGLLDEHPNGADIISGTHRIGIPHALDERDLESGTIWPEDEEVAEAGLLVVRKLPLNSYGQRENRALYESNYVGEGDYIVPSVLFHRYGSDDFELWTNDQIAVRELKTARELAEHFESEGSVPEWFDPLAHRQCGIGADGALYVFDPSPGSRDPIPQVLMKTLRALGATKNIEMAGTWPDNVA